MRVALAAVGILCSSLSAQYWRQTPGTVHPRPDGFLAMAYDAVRGRTVCFTDDVVMALPSGSNSLGRTWEWNGQTWLQRFPATAPSAQASRHAMAWDPTRGRVVLINRSGQTWSFDGSSWQLEPITGPSFGDPSLCFDAARGVLVVADHGALREVQNGAWAVRATFPAILTGARIGFDPIGGRVLAFGGFDGGFPTTTWSWDGVALTAVATAPLQSRTEHAMVTDPVAGRLLLIGGTDYQTQQGLATVHSWNGTAWTPEPSLPTSRGDFAAAVHAGELLIYGGRGAGTSAADVLRRTAAGTFAPVPRVVGGEVAAHDPVRNRTVSVVGGRTLESDGRTWTDVNLAPPANVVALSAHGSPGGLVALAGGSMWRYDGTAWTAGAAHPVVAAPVLALDPARNRLVLTGTGGGGQRVVWEWDGASWSNPGAANPPAAVVAALGWDAAGQRLVLVQIESTSQRTYAWDGVAWTSLGVLPIGGFVLDVNVQLAATPQLGLVLLSSITDPFSSHDSAAQLVGNTWVGLVGRVDTRRTSGPTVYDGTRDAIVRFDAATRSEWVMPLADATAAVVGAGCGGTNGVPRLTAANLPQLGADVHLDAAALAPASVMFLLGDVAGASAPLPGGCTQLVANPIVLAAAPTNTSGFASATWAVPVLPAVRGIVVHTQALGLDPAGALLGFASLTAAVQLRIGD